MTAESGGGSAVKSLVPRGELVNIVDLVDVVDLADVH